MNFVYIKDALKKKLKDVDIDYLHIPELGIESEERILIPKQTMRNYSRNIDKLFQSKRFI